MLKTTLIMVVDGIAICATRRKMPDDGNIESQGCTVCYEQRGPWIYICDLTQHGMFEDDTRTVVECPHCHSQFFFQYMIPAYDVIVDEDGSGE
jgi:hypothetical protein